MGNDQINVQYNSPEQKFASGLQKALSTFFVDAFDELHTELG